MGTSGRGLVWLAPLMWYSEKWSKGDAGMNESKVRLLFWGIVYVCGRKEVDEG